jgi:UDP-N-acetylglucosamine 4,6-dehydratase
MIGNILITGGTGTLGHAIVRTAEAQGWDARLTIFSRSEHRQAVMRARYPHLRYILGDVRDAQGLAAAVVGNDVVIHAAAMKRIPEAEAQPAECVAVNIVGSQNVARACVAAGVKLCIGISTDKAARASTVYGASKLALEGLWRAQAPTPTRFVLCRYGNVLASNGSVLQLWREQAARGEALTITDERCTRFWMSEADAVQVIRETARLEAGQVYIPKMEALNIAQMAKMLYPGHILRVTGLRSLEKLHEDLVHTDEQAREYSGFYILGPHGTTGHAYTSAEAPPIALDALRQMIAEGA